MSRSSLPTVCVINSNEDFVDLTRRYLVQEGYVAVSAGITDIKFGNIDIAAFIAEHDPRVIILDIAFPYQENWVQYQHIKSLEVCRDRVFIVTTPNLEALHTLVGPDIEAHSIIDKVVDLRRLVELVKQAWPVADPDGLPLKP